MVAFGRSRRGLSIDPLFGVCRLPVVEKIGVEISLRVCVTRCYRLVVVVVVVVVAVAVAVAVAVVVVVAVVVLTLIRTMKSMVVTGQSVESLWSG